MFLVLSESTQKGHSAGYQRCALLYSNLTSSLHSLCIKGPPPHHGILRE